MPSRNVNVRGIINKVAGVGLVRKYFGRENYITIRPECHIVKPNHQEQVYITHKKMGKHNLQHGQALQKTTKRILNLLEQTIDSYSY
jgi:hypothetical protein